jgi:hypothetical protein
MTRLLSILLLASFLAGLGGVGAQAADSARPQIVAPQMVVLGQAGGHSDGRMTMDCPACPMMGACVASESAQFVPPDGTPLKVFQPSSQISDSIRAPDTAPPKSFSV